MSENRLYRFSDFFFIRLSFFRLKWQIFMSKKRERICLQKEKDDYIIKAQILGSILLSKAFRQIFLFELY